MPKDSSAFTDALMADNAKGRKCDLSRAFTKMTPEMAEQVRNAMAAPEVTAAAISRTLQRFDFEVPEGSVRRCRRTCKCWRG